MLLNCGVGEDSWESLGLQGDPASPFWRRSVLGVHWKDWGWGWNSNPLATSCEELTHWKRPWCWEGLGAGGEGDNRGWDGWMPSLTRRTWVWLNSGSCWWTGRPGMLRFIGSQRVRHDWATELNWMGFPGGASGKDTVCQCRRWKRCRFDPWVGKIPGWRKWQPIPVFLPGESHYFIIFKYLFICLAVAGLSCHTQVFNLCCRMCGLLVVAQELLVVEYEI